VTVSTAIASHIKFRQLAIQTGRPARRPRSQLHVLLRPCEADRCVTLSLIGLLKESLDVLHNWEARHAGEWEPRGMHYQHDSLFLFRNLALGARLALFDDQLEIANGYD
jgi:hypothetical protein